MGWVQERRSTDDVAVAALHQAMQTQQEVVRRMARVVRVARTYAEMRENGVEVWESEQGSEAEAFAQLQDALEVLDSDGRS